MKNNIFSKIFNALLSVIVFIAIFSCLIWFIHTFNIFPLPENIENLFWSNSENKVNLDEIENRILELLDEGGMSDDGEYEYLLLTPEKATELLGDFKKCDKYYWEVETSTTSLGNTRKQIHRIYKSGDKIRVDTVDDFSDFTTVFSDGTTSLKNNLTGEIKKINGDTEFTYDNVVNIAALDYLFSYDDTKVSYVGVSNSNGEKYLYVEIPKTSLEGMDKYFISLDYGVVFNATSVVDSKTVFEQKTIAFDDVSLISDETFVISNSEEGA